MFEHCQVIHSYVVLLCSNVKIYVRTYFITDLIFPIYIYILISFFFFKKMAHPVTTRKREREGTKGTSQIGCRTIMAKHEVFINEFDGLTWDRKSLRFMFVSRGWTNICQLRGSIYPSMVQEFYMEMLSMTQDASSHTVTVCNIQFEISADVIAHLLGLHRISKASSTVDA